jgi:predicted PilT family ATPase
MCGVMEGLAIFGAVTSLVGGQEQAYQTSQAAEENLEAQYEQTAVKQEQINESSALEMHERQKQGMIDRAEARAIAGESGALGFSSDRLMADSFMQQGTDIMSIERNRSNQAKQGDVNNKSYRAQAQSTANTAYNNAPSLIETGLQIGGTIAKYNKEVDTKSKG